MTPPACGCGHLVTSHEQSHPAGSLGEGTAVSPALGGTELHGTRAVCGDSWRHRPGSGGVHRAEGDGDISVGGTNTVAAPVGVPITVPSRRSAPF